MKRLNAFIETSANLVDMLKACSPGQQIPLGTDGVYTVSAARNKYKNGFAILLTAGGQKWNIAGCKKVSELPLCHVLPIAKQYVADFKPYQP